MFEGKEKNILAVLFNNKKKKKEEIMKKKVEKYLSLVLKSYGRNILFVS